MHGFVTLVCQCRPAGEVKPCISASVHSKQVSTFLTGLVCVATDHCLITLLLEHMRPHEKRPTQDPECISLA